MDNKITLGYWAFRGRGQIARHLLSYTGADWQDKMYSERNDWFNKDKKEIGFSFPNLPYVVHGEAKVTESLAVYRYIIAVSDKKQLLGKDLKDQAMVDNIQGVYLDSFNPISKLMFSQNYKEQLPKTLETIKRKFVSLQKFYGDKEFALGYPTLPDFQIAEQAHYIKAISQQYYEQFPFLQRVKNAIQNLPEVKSYYEKQGAIKSPFLPPIANINPQA